MEKINIKNKLEDLLEKIPDYFEKDELAYYSSQCKNEQQIRDKIAWQLHKWVTKEYGEKYVVRREWAPEGFGKKRVDLAVLEMKADKKIVDNVIALIEFKAQSIARREKWYLYEFAKDVEKLRDIKHDKQGVCKNADLYFVFLETGQDGKADKYHSVLGFSPYQTSKCVYCKGVQDKKYLDAIKLHWEAFNKGEYEVKYEGKRLQPISIPDPKAIEIGEAFGYTQYVSPLVIGPLEFTCD